MGDIRNGSFSYIFGSLERYFVSLWMLKWRISCKILYEDLVGRVIKMDNFGGTKP